MELHPRLPLERLENFERYNAWERQAAKEDLPDPAARLAWPEETYELARISGVLRRCPRLLRLGKKLLPAWAGCIGSWRRQKRSMDSYHGALIISVTCGMIKRRGR